MLAHLEEAGASTSRPTARLTTRQPPVCLYHANCADGFTAAVIFARFRPDAEFVAASYDGKPPDLKRLRDRDVLMLDFSYPREATQALLVAARTLLVLDHHKTAQAALSALTTATPAAWASYYRTGEETAEVEEEGAAAVFDMNRSGAGITWDFFNPNKPRPKFIDYVEDRDLWRFALPASREIAAWIFSHDYDRVIWERLIGQLPSLSGRKAAIIEGTAILRKQWKDIRELAAAGTQIMTIGGHAVPVINLPYTLASDAAGFLAETADAGFAASYWDGRDARAFSLRSRGSDIDVAEIAKRYGGGGHAAAAGFRMPLGWRGDGDRGAR